MWGTLLTGLLTKGVSGSVEKEEIKEPMRDVDYLFVGGGILLVILFLGGAVWGISKIAAK